MRGINQPSLTARQIQEVGDQIIKSRAAGKRHLTIIFAGPPSPEKLQAAETLGRQLSRPVQRINLAALVSKYIGETEKNLRQLLAKAESQDVILLFDEADDLFGKRTTATDQQDRYANLQVASLLQRIEAYQGIVILTSNHRETINKIRHDRLVEFAPLPKNACPPDCPVPPPAKSQGIRQ